MKKITKILAELDSGNSQDADLVDALREANRNLVKSSMSDEHLRVKSAIEQKLGIKHHVQKFPAQDQ